MQVHEPILTLSGSEALEGEAAACYALLAAQGVPLNVVVPYDDVPGQPHTSVPARLPPVPPRLAAASRCPPSSSCLPCIHLCVRYESAARPGPHA